MTEKIIIELNKDEIELIAALVHKYFSETESDVAKSAILALVEQTNYVSSDPDRHGMTSGIITSAQSHSAYLWGQRVSNVDLSNLSPMVYDMESFGGLA